MNVDEFLSGARDAMSVRRVYGDPIEQNGTIVVPAAAVSGGGGGGGDNEDNGGGGFGLHARPVGAYVVKNGEVTWKPALDPFRLAMVVLAAIVVRALVLRR